MQAFEIQTKKLSLQNFTDSKHSIGATFESVPIRNFSLFKFQENIDVDRQCSSRSSSVKCL